MPSIIYSLFINRTMKTEKNSSKLYEQKENANPETV